MFAYFSLNRIEGKRASITSEDDVHNIEPQHTLPFFETVESHYRSTSNGLNYSSRIGCTIQMSSTTRCVNCNFVLYDEHIMAKWSYQQSDLNTSCTMCANRFVPSLYICYRVSKLGRLYYCDALIKNNIILTFVSVFFQFLPVVDVDCKLAAKFSPDENTNCDNVKSDKTKRYDNSLIFYLF